MTNQELNRDIKRLYNNIKKLSNSGTEAGQKKYYDYVANEAAKEFSRLFWADKEMEAMNRQSLLIMLRLNVKHRFIPFHQFGLFIDL